MIGRYAVKVKVKVTDYLIDWLLDSLIVRVTDGQRNVKSKYPAPY